MHNTDSSSPQADAGKEFVLESKGTWIHAGYHLTSATAAPPLLALPFAMARLGWAPGILALIVAAAVSFYGCYLLSLATEELEVRGIKCFRYWDVASHVMGPTWAHYVVAPLQYLVCYIAVIALILLGGGTLELHVLFQASDSVQKSLSDYIQTPFKLLLCFYNHKCVSTTVLMLVVVGKGKRRESLILPYPVVDISNFMNILSFLEPLLLSSPNYHLFILFGSSIYYRCYCASVSVIVRLLDQSSLVKIDGKFFNNMHTSQGTSFCPFVIGIASQAPPKDYSIRGSHVHIMFGTFNAVSIMVTAYANPIIVEIQATLAPPATGKMLKGLLICYSVVLFTVFSVSITGYWAFGNSAQGIIFSNMEPLVPKWLYILGNAFACLQLIVTSAVYLQPVFAKYEGLVVDVKAGRFSFRNVLLRLLGRSVLVSVATLFAAMLPFFSDFSALIGAFGFVPLCIILPLVFYILVFRNKTVRFSLLQLVNIAIIVLASAVTIVGTVAAVRQIVLDVNTYRLFPST